MQTYSTVSASLSAFSYNHNSDTTATNYCTMQGQLPREQRGPFGNILLHPHPRADLKRGCRDVSSPIGQGMHKMDICDTDLSSRNQKYVWNNVKDNTCTLKKGVAGNVCNYRPIALTCVPSKVMERGSGWMTSLTGLS